MESMVGITAAYWERNQLVLFLTKLYPSCVGIDDDAESPEWAYVVYVNSPEGQLSWHVHEDEIKQYFPHLTIHPGVLWDGHTTEEKYERLRRLG